MWLLTVLPFWLAISIALLCSVAAASSAFYCVNALMALPALWKPCYITADDTGVGITSWFGSRATRWDDIIASTRYDILYHQILYTRSGMPLLLNTCGYPKAVIDEVGEVVKERSRLVRRDQTWWRHALYGRSYSGYFREGYHMVFPDSLVKDRPLPPPPEVDALTEGETHQ